MGQGGWQWAHTDGSYAAASDPRLLFPLTKGAAPATRGAASATSGAASATVEVVWPDGAVEEFAGVAPNRYHVLRRGAASAVEQP